MNKLGKIIVDELLDVLNESDASDEAKKRGLSYNGFGRWVDKSGKVVAKTEDGKLVDVGSDDEKLTTKLSTKKSSKEKETDKKKESKIKTLVGIFAGRFQPFGKHHFQAYEQLRSITGNNSFIATSNITDSEKSPFTFSEKQAIISKYGISKKNIVKVKNPYRPVEILDKFDAKTTALVVIFGEKDAGRLGGSGKYYLPFKNIKDLEGYGEHGYYIIARHESVMVAGHEISGTIIRKLLGSRRIEKNRKKKIFKEIFGWYDPNIFEMTVDRLEGVAKEAHMRCGILITEGGAYGHLSHPFEDMNLTFGDFKNIIRLSLQGHLDKEAQVSEKLDGQALSISWKDGKLIAARNRGQLKNGGANALDVNGIKTMFAGRGELTTAFSSAVDDLESAIKGLTEKQKQAVFQNGMSFMATEIIYPPTQNVIPYGENLIVFHGIIQYDNDGTPIGENKGDARMLAGMIRQINKNVQRTFTITAPSFLTVPASQDFAQKQRTFVEKVNMLKNKFGLKDSDPVALYHQKWWEDFILRKAKALGYALTNNTLIQLMKRWAFGEKSPSITQILNVITEDIKVSLEQKFADWAKSFDKENHDKQVKENMFPFETLFLSLGTEVLKNVSGFLAANPNKTIQSIRKGVQRAVKELSGSSDLSKIEKMKSELQKIQAIGGMEAIVPSEGLVFTYGGKNYKLTGEFAPINQILGMLKYGD